MKFPWNNYNPCGNIVSWNKLRKFTTVISKMGICCKKLARFLAMEQEKPKLNDKPGARPG
jgi:hypothetical protein